MVTARFDAVAEATDTFKKLFQKRNWLVILPYAAGQFLIGSLAGVFALALYIAAFSQVVTRAAPPSNMTPFVVMFGVGLAIFILFAVVVFEFVYAWTLAAAEPIWTGGDPALDRGLRRAAATFLQLIFFQILITLLAIASLLIVVGPIIVAVLAIYAPPYIVLGGRSATQAIGDSFRLASENLGATLTLVLALIVVWLFAIAAILLTIFIPFGPVAVGCTFRSYVALAIERFYLLLAPHAGAAPIPIVPETSV